MYMLPGRALRVEKPALPTPIYPARATKQIDALSPKRPSPANSKSEDRRRISRSLLRASAVSGRDKNGAGPPLELELRVTDCDPDMLSVLELATDEELEDLMRTLHGEVPMLPAGLRKETAAC
jgi:hypothetical protein